MRSSTKNLCTKKLQLLEQQSDIVPSPTHHRMQRIAQCPLGVFRAGRSSVFLCPMVGSMALA